MHQEVLRCSKSFAAAHGIGGGCISKHFNIFSSENVFRSIFMQGDNLRHSYCQSGTFGFTHLMDLSPAEVTFLANGSCLEQLLFSIMRWDRQFLDGIVDFVTESIYGPENGPHELGKVRAVTRMLLMPSISQTDLLRRKLATGPGDAPFEALVIPQQERLQLNVGLLHSAYTFIPRTRAPPVYFFFSKNLLLFLFL